MRIPNPFPRDKNVRFTCRPGDCRGVVGPCEELDVPDDSEEVLIESVDQGNTSATYVFASRIWSKWGVISVEDHLKKMKIEEEEKKLQEEKTKLAKRRERTCGPKILLDDPRDKISE